MEEEVVVVGVSGGGGGGGGVGVGGGGGGGGGGGVCVCARARVLVRSLLRSSQYVKSGRPDTHCPLIPFPLHTRAQRAERAVLPPRAWR
eukprot:977705-Prymnesium_polylepis.1